MHPLINYLSMRSVIFCVSSYAEHKYMKTDLFYSCNNIERISSKA